MHTITNSPPYPLSQHSQPFQHIPFPALPFLKTEPLTLVYNIHRPSLHQLRRSETGIDTDIVDSSTCLRHTLTTTYDRHNRTQNPTNHPPG